MKNMNLKKLMIIALTAMPISLFAQDGASAPEPVRNTFEHGFVMNNFTTETNGNHSLDVAIQHRFGTMDRFDDLYGIYAPSNIRLNFTYGITRDLTMGFGSCKTQNTYDLNWKYKLLKQKTSGMPVTVTYFGNVARKFINDTKILNSTGVTNQYNKLTYYNELMISRKVNSHLSLQVGGYCAYYNLIDSASYAGKHLFYGVTAVGRYKFSPQSSILVEYNHPLGVDDIAKATQPKPNLGIGLEVSTGNHQFQIFVCNANGILSQDSKLYNTNDFKNLGVPSWIIGFNITRQWGF